MVSFSSEPTSSRPACGISESRQVKFHIQKWYSGNVEAANGCAATNGSNDLYNVGPPFTIAKLVNITSITMVYDTYNILLTSINYIVNGICKPTYNWLAPHCNAAKTQHDPLSGSTKGVFFLFLGPQMPCLLCPWDPLGPSDQVCQAKNIEVCNSVTRKRLIGSGPGRAWRPFWKAFWWRLKHICLILFMIYVQNGRVKLKIAKDS